MFKKYKNLIILAAIAALLISGVLLFKSQNIGTQTLWNISRGGQWLFPLVTVGALLDSINPCAFSILLLTIAFLFTLGKTRSGILKIGGLYIFGLFLTYILIGLGILQTLQLFNTPRFMAKVGASLLILLGGINLINRYFPSFPIKLRIPQSAHRSMAKLMDKASIPSAFLLGVLVALCEFPCTGGPYLMVLGLLHDKAQFLNGAAYLLWYNIVFVLPLIIILLIAGNKALLEKAQEWKTANSARMRLISGAAMVILGIIIFLL